jgi:NAD dependent epimerase/dehydratase
VKSGARVRALVYYNSWNEIGWLRDVAKDVVSEVEILLGDIRDVDITGRGVESCEYVFHLSSLIGIPYSYDATRSYVDTNVGGALNVLQACRASKTLTRLVHVSTSEVYGTAQQVPIHESHPLVAQSPYSATKIAADKLAESFHLSFGVPVVIARPFNTFGPRQTARAVIPTIASQLLEGHSELRLGSLHPKRDFNYVTDTASGLLALGLARAAEGQVVNIGSGEDWSIAQTVEMLCEIVGRKAVVVTDEARVRPKRSEVDVLLADNTRIRQFTGWHPQVSFKEGLTRTVAWVKANLRYFDARRYAR